METVCASALPPWQCFGAVKRWLYGLYVRNLYVHRERMSHGCLSGVPRFQAPVREKEQP